jgi:hypothetical protein
MATKIMMQHPTTGISKSGFYGFSWTTFLFGGFPALFRGDILIGLVVIVLNVLTWWIAGIIWSFFYNKYFTLRLVEKGYVFVGSDSEIASAKSALGIRIL